MIAAVGTMFWGAAYAIVGRLVLDVVAYEIAEHRRRGADE